MKSKVIGCPVAKVSFVLLWTHWTAIGAAIAGIILGLVGSQLELVRYAIGLLFFGFTMLVPMGLIVLPFAVFHSWHAIKRRYGWVGPR